MSNPRKRRVSTLGSRLTSVVSVCLVLVLLGLVSMCWVAGRNGSKMLHENMTFVVKVDRGCDSLATRGLLKTLSDAPYSSSAILTTADEILKEESAYLGEDVLALTDINPYNAEIEVKMAEAYAIPDSVAAISARVSMMPGVESTLAQVGGLKNVAAGINHISFIMLIVAAALLAISIVLINNTVYLSVYSRRFIIGTMKLVGATSVFIRRPFIKAGVLTGLSAGILAIPILVIMKYYAGTIEPAVASFVTVKDEVVIYAVLIILGVAICAVASGVATSRYLRADYDNMFK